MKSITIRNDDLSYDEYLDAFGPYHIYDDEGNVVEIVDSRREAEEYVSYHPEWSYQ